jgi:hypothetical protein
MVPAMRLRPIVAVALFCLMAGACGSHGDQLRCVRLDGSTYAAAKSGDTARCDPGDRPVTPRK